MKINDLQEELLYKENAKRLAPKGSDTLTSFDRDVFWYNRDEVARQKAIAEREDLGRVTYEDHRKAIEMAVYMLKNDTQKDIAMTILSHRWFKAYRAKAFKGRGDFYDDYSFLITRIGMVFTAATSKIVPVSAASKLSEFTEPTLVQINYITGTTKAMKVNTTKVSLDQWVSKYNDGAPESTVYHIAGYSQAA